MFGTLSVNSGVWPKSASACITALAPVWFSCRGFICNIVLVQYKNVVSKYTRKLDCICPRRKTISCECVLVNLFSILSSDPSENLGIIFVSTEKKAHNNCSVFFSTSIVKLLEDRSASSVSAFCCHIKLCGKTRFTDAFLWYVYSVPAFLETSPLNVINLAPVDLRVIKHTCVFATAPPKHVAFLCSYCNTDQTGFSSD